MNKYLEKLGAYVSNFNAFASFEEAYVFWNEFPILSKKELEKWIEKQYIEKSNFQIEIEYVIEDDYNYLPACFVVKLKIEEELSIDPKSQELQKKLKKISEEIGRDYFVSVQYHNNRSEYENLLRDLKSLQNLIGEKLQFNITFLVDNEYFEDFFQNSHSNENLIINKNKYERDLFKIDLTILGFDIDLLNDVLTKFPKFVYDSKGTIIKEWNPMHVEGWSKSR